jgi:hypothetical protein
MAGGRRKQPEQQFHKAVVAFLNYALPPNIILFHVPNGGGRSKAEAGLLKAMGVRAGMPDLGVILPTGVVAWMELKAERGTLTAAQREFRDLMRARGVPFAECRTLQEVEAFVGGLIEPFGYRLMARAA